MFQMKGIARRLLLTGIFTAMILAATLVPAYSYWMYVLIYGIDYIDCVDDGNNAHVNASVIFPQTLVADAVCPDDPFDWYLVPLQGDLGWEGIFYCIADGPGLVFRLYADTGSGLNLLKEGSPAADTESETNLWGLVWKFKDIANDLGHDFVPAGNFYVRVSHYSAYPEDHPYFLMLMMGPGEHEQSDANTGPKRLLAPGMIHYGHVDTVNTSDLFKFTLNPGDNPTGIIALGEVMEGVGGRLADSSQQPEYNLRLTLFNPDGVKIASVMPSESMTARIDLNIMSNVPPGQYMIEVSMAATSPEPGEGHYYMLLNHALAPATGDWAPDANKNKATGITLQEGVPVSDAIYAGRDLGDYYKFSSPGYFLGDIRVEPPMDTRYITLDLYDSANKEISAGDLAGFGLCQAYDPLKPGNYSIRLWDPVGLLNPAKYTITLYPHGDTRTKPAEFSTWQTAYELPADDSSADDDMLHMILFPWIASDLKPGVQDALFVKLVVPEGKFLAGYYDIYGSRPGYKVSIGKIVQPGQPPAWSPPLSPDAYGFLLIDMDYEYLADPGTYYLRIQPPDGVTGQTRVLIENNARLTECVSDDNNTFYEALDLRGSYLLPVPGFDQLCPGLDDADWFYFYTNNYDPQVGPLKKLTFKGGVEGMRMEFYDSDMVMKFYLNYTSAGQVVTYELKNYVKPGELYRVKIEANAAVEKVQVYDLKLADVLQWTPRPFKFYNDYNWLLKLKPGAFQLLGGEEEGDDDDDGMEHIIQGFHRKQ